MKKLFTAAFLLASCACAMAQEPSDTTSFTSGTPDDDIMMLDDLVVTARKKLIKADAEKVTYEASEDPDAQSLSALDIMHRVPMVSVDGQNNITVNGSSDFKVYVDGKPNPMLSSNPGQLLRSIPASAIARIEVINNPGAAYDAEGTGGILNIVLKAAGNNMDGYTATLTGMAGNRNSSASIYAMMQRDKVALTANISAMHYTSGRIDLDQDRLNTADGSRLLNPGSINSQFNNFDASLSLDWKPDTRNIFSFSGSFSRSPYRQYMESTVARYEAGADAPSSGYGLYSRQRNRTVGVTAGADYTHLFSSDDRHKLMLSYRLNITPYRSLADNTFSVLTGLTSGDVPDDYATTDHTSMTENMAQADYNIPLGERHLFGAGAKLTFRRSSSDAAGLDYVHHSTIGAGYLSYSLTAGDFSLHAGARYEYTHQSARYGNGDYDPYEADYDNFVPSANISYSFAPARTLSAGYNMRISRPGINMLNPYVDTSNPLQVTTGNPSLRPEKYNNINLTWSAMWGPVMFNAQATYSFCHDGITSITEMRDGITYQSYFNSLRSRNATASLFMTYTPWTDTRITLNSSTTYSSLRSPLAGVANHGWTERYMAGVQQTLSWKLQLSANIFGQTGMKGLQMSSNGFLTHMFSLSRAFVSDRLNISITAMSPFCGSNKIKMHEWGRGMDNHTNLRLNLRSVMLSVSYRFGALQPRRSTTREIESDLAAPASSGSSIPGGLPGTGL